MYSGIDALEGVKYRDIKIKINVTENNVLKSVNN